MTENQVLELGFGIDMEYAHDQFVTRRYIKDMLSVEFTYEGEDLLTCEVTIQEVNSHPVSFIELKLLDEIINMGKPNLERKKGYLRVKKSTLKYYKSL